MKKILLIVCVSMFFGIIGCNNLQEKKSFDYESEISNIKDVLESYVIANETQDIELIQKIWAPDDDIIIFGTKGDEKLIGWEAIRDATQEQFNSFENTLISVRDQVVKINKFGDIAWFSEVINYNFILDGKARSYEGIRYTGVLEKRGTDWFIIQSHMSIPAETN
jgi:ketosteroid isomerase-like protein